MLIESPRLSPQDMQAWERLERYDLAIGPTLRAKAAEAGSMIARFWDEHPDTVCSTSWGKDSVVVAHLARRADPEIPIVWVPTIRADGVSYEADDTYRVRDAFLEAFPGVYEERPQVARNPKRGDPHYSPDQYEAPGYRSQDVLKDAIKGPYISGVRAEESAMRTKSLRWHGVATDRTCRPIIRWTAIEVFAYLSHHGLPVHPAYAASFGGRLDRRWLRVHPLRSKPPARSAVYGGDPDAWEDTYYPTLIKHQPRKV